MCWTESKLFTTSHFRDAKAWINFTSQRGTDGNMDICVATPCQSSELKPLIHTQVIVLAHYHSRFSGEKRVRLKKTNSVKTNKVFHSQILLGESTEARLLKIISISSFSNWMRIRCMFSQSALCNACGPSASPEWRNDLGLPSTLLCIWQFLTVQF